MSTLIPIVCHGCGQRGKVAALPADLECSVCKTGENLDLDDYTAVPPPSIPEQDDTFTTRHPDDPKKVPSVPGAPLYSDRALATPVNAALRTAAEEPLRLCPQHAVGVKVPVRLVGPGEDCERCRRWGVPAPIEPGMMAARKQASGPGIYVFDTAGNPVDGPFETYDEAQARMPMGGFADYSGGIDLASRKQAVRPGGIKGIAIYPDKRVQDVTVHSLADMQAIVKGYIEAVDLKDGSTMYVNEEGLYQFTKDDVNWIAADVASLGGRPEFMFGKPPLLGPVLIVGPVDDEGESTDVTETARRWVQRVAREAVRKQAAVERVPASQIRAGDYIDLPAVSNWKVWAVTPNGSSIDFTMTGGTGDGPGTVKTFAPSDPITRRVFETDPAVVRAHILRSFPRAEFLDIQEIDAFVADGKKVYGWWNDQIVQVRSVGDTKRYPGIVLLWAPNTTVDDLVRRASRKQAADDKTEWFVARVAPETPRGFVDISGPYDTAAEAEVAKPQGEGYVTYPMYSVQDQAAYERFMTASRKQALTHEEWGRLSPIERRDWMRKATPAERAEMFGPHRDVAPSAPESGNWRSQGYEWNPGYAGPGGEARDQFYDDYYREPGDPVYASRKVAWESEDQMLSDADDRYAANNWYAVGDGKDRIYWVTSDLEYVAVYVVQDRTLMVNFAPTSKVPMIYRDIDEQAADAKVRQMRPDAERGPAPKTSKVDQIVAAVRKANPWMSRRTALRVAQKTVLLYPAVAAKTANLTTPKGYTLTDEQQARLDALEPLAKYGPDYNRAVGDSLSRVRNAEDSADVEMFLGDAEQAAGKTGSKTAGAPSDVCPRCGAHMDDVTVANGVLTARCKACGWSGTKRQAGRRTAMPNPADLGVKVGDVFYTSWGYDQTNVEFYEVTGLTGASVRVREVAQEAPRADSDSVVPRKGDYIGSEITKRLLDTGSNRPTIKINDSAHAWLWDGKPKYRTPSGWGH